MKLFFDISEWFILDGYEAELPLTTDVAQKIMQNHLLEINPVRDELGMPVHVRSGYRPQWWERMKGRDGDSQHCYIEDGATDISIEKHSDNPHKSNQTWIRFLRLLKQTSYKRIAYYPELRFFHCDYQGNDRKYYISKQGWEQIDFQSLANKMRSG